MCFFDKDETHLVNPFSSIRSPRRPSGPDPSCREGRCGREDTVDHKACSVFLTFTNYPINPQSLICSRRTSHADAHLERDGGPVTALCPRACRWVSCAYISFASEV